MNGERGAGGNSAWPEPGTEEYRDIKQKLNKEGLERGGRRDAAVVVGSREDVERMLAEGRTADTQTYIHLNSETYTEDAELESAVNTSTNPVYYASLLDSFRKAAPGVAVIIGRDGADHNQVWYKSGDGSIKSLRFEPAKVDKPKYNVNSLGGLEAELKELGFQVEGINPGSGRSYLTELVSLAYQHRLKKSAKEKRGGFQF